MRVWRVAKDRLLNDKAGESGWLIGVDSSVVDAIVASHTSQKHQKQFYSLENPLDILPEGFKVIGIYRSASNSHAEADGISSSITSTSSRAMDTSSTRNSEQVMCVIDREEKSLGFFLDGKAVCKFEDISNVFSAATMHPYQYTHTGKYVCRSITLKKPNVL